MKKVMMIVNPSSGKEEAGTYVERIQKELGRAGYRIDVRLTEKEGDATAFAAAACTAEYEAVVSVGGDGTLNEVINGLAENTHRPALGVIPLGTVNDFARALHIPLEPEAAATVIREGNLQKADVGIINGHYFLNIAALGEIAESAAQVPSEQKTVLGSLAYFLEGAKAIVNKKPFNLTVTSTEKQWQGEAITCLVALTNSVGGFKNITPDAQLNDGKLHCLVIQDMDFLKLARTAAEWFKDELQTARGVLYFCADELTVSSDENLRANVDGDIREEAPFTFQVLKEHLNVFAPSSNQLKDIDRYS